MGCRFLEKRLAFETPKVNTVIVALRTASMMGAKSITSVLRASGHFTYVDFSGHPPSDHRVRGHPGDRIRFRQERLVVSFVEVLHE